jgi:hypothetical protein
MGDISTKAYALYVIINIVTVFFTRVGGAYKLQKKSRDSINTSYLTEYLLKSRRSRKSYETEVVGTLQQMTEAEKSSV